MCTDTRYPSVFKEEPAFLCTVSVYSLVYPVYVHVRLNICKIRDQPPLPFPLPTRAMCGLDQVLGLGLDTVDGDYSVKPQGIWGGNIFHCKIIHERNKNE